MNFFGEATRPQIRARATLGASRMGVVSSPWRKPKLHSKKDGERISSRDWIAEFLQVCDEKGNLPKPYLSGGDLVQMGFQPGPRLGKTLEAIYRLKA